DIDNDGILNLFDNCPNNANENQLDSDGDGVGNACDNCQPIYNPYQEDADGNGKGDICEADDDGDGIINERDNCPNSYNPDDTDSDEDGIGDFCDNCPYVSNPDQDPSACSDAAAAAIGELNAAYAALAKASNPSFRKARNLRKQFLSLAKVFQKQDGSQRLVRKLKSTTKSLKLVMQAKTAGEQDNALEALDDAQVAARRAVRIAARMLVS
ncbi:MAG: thrombospondin type 3 repeat-containing protein, partial [Bdellovibrionales bacterium]|nr:thrombospondin type 3 repeat-containing protein [Bdellovibrionales bacterium]